MESTLFVTDLQLFSENSAGAEPAVTSEPVSDQVVTETPSVEQNSFDYANATRDERRAMVESFFMEPDTEQGTPQETQLKPGEQSAGEATEFAIPDKFRNPDGTVNIQALAQSYSHAESKIGEQGNRIGEYSKQIQELTARLKQMEDIGQQQQQSAHESEVAPMAEQVEFDSEAWFDRFYAQPVEALKELLQGTLEPRFKELEPVVQHFREEQERSFWANRVSQVQDKYPDFDQYREKAAEILREQPSGFLDLPNAIEAAYLMAKAQVLDAEKAGQPTLEQALKDPAFLSQLSQNPEIQKMVLKSYSEQVSGEPKPTMLGKQPGGVAPSAPPPEIRSTRDATKAFKAFLMGGGTQ